MILSPLPVYSESNRFPVMLLTNKQTLYNRCNCFPVMLLNAVTKLRSLLAKLQRYKINYTHRRLKTLRTGCRRVQVERNRGIDFAPCVDMLTLESAMTITVPNLIIWSWYTGRSWVGCYIWYSEKGTRRGRSPPGSSLYQNVTAHPSTASVYQSPYCCVMVRCSAIFNVFLNG